MRKLSTTFKELCSEKMFWFLSIYLIAWILLLIWAFTGSHAQGQAIDNVTVSGTIVDSDSITWTNGTWKAQLQNPRGGTVTYIDTGVPVATQFSGVLNSSGAFSQAGVPNNSALAPAGTSWVFTFCPDASFQCTSLPNLAFNSGQSTYDISSLATSNIVAPRFPALGHQSWGYTDGEVNPVPNVGGIYFNVASSQLRYWDGTKWVPVAGGSGFCNPTTLGGDCVVTDPTTDQSITQPNGTMFQVTSVATNGNGNEQMQLADGRFYLFNSLHNGQILADGFCGIDCVGMMGGTNGNGYLAVGEATPFSIVPNYELVDIEDNGMELSSNIFALGGCYTPQLNAQCQLSSGGYGPFYWIDTTGGNLTRTLPAAVAPWKGTGESYNSSIQVIVYKMDSTANTLTISPAAGDTIENYPSGYVLSKQWQGVKLVSDGYHEWFVSQEINSNPTPGTCGDATHVCQITTNSNGIVKSQNQVAVSSPVNSGIPYQMASYATSGTIHGSSSILDVSSVPYNTIPVTQIVSYNNTTGVAVLSVNNSFPTGGGTPLMLSISVPNQVAACNYVEENFPIMTTAATATTITFTDTSYIGYLPSCSNVTTSLDSYVEPTMLIISNVSEDASNNVTVTVPSTSDITSLSRIVVSNMPASFSYLNGLSFVLPTSITSNTVTFVDYTGHGAQSPAPASASLFLVPESMQINSPNQSVVISSNQQTRIEGSGGLWINQAKGGSNNALAITCRSDAVNQKQCFGIFDTGGHFDSELGYDNGTNSYYSRLDVTGTIGTSRFTMYGGPVSNAFWFGIPNGENIKFTGNYGGTNYNTSIDFQNFITAGRGSGNFEFPLLTGTALLAALQGTLTPGNPVKIDPTGQFLINATAPHMTWTGNVGGQTYAATTTDIGANVWQTSSAITITRLDLHVGAAASSCTTYPVVGVYDSTTSSFVATTTLTNGAFSIFNATNANVAAGDQLRLGIQTAAAGCTVASSSLWWTMEYKMQ